MAMQADGTGGKSEELKTQFATREGVYRLMTLSEYSRPNRVGYTNTQGSCPVRVSFVSLPDPNANGDRICFNFGKELYVYPYKGVRKAADLTKPVDKRVYKGTNPTCHDFNQASATAESASLLVGFSGGQIQLIDPIRKELSKLYNEERLIDKTRVTCVRWVPRSPALFLAAHASGQLYVYSEDLSCGSTAPHYQLWRQAEGASVYACKTRSSRNPLYRWALGDSGASVNEVAFSPCGSYLATAGQDGCLRVFRFDTMEPAGMARSYFGGLLCVGWSPDGKLVAAGGEDDLVTVFSIPERRVVARGQGHRSWVSVVAFDPFAPASDSHTLSSSSSSSSSTTGTGTAPFYRLGSVGQDTQLCLWDLTSDQLRASSSSSRASRACSSSGVGTMGGQSSSCTVTTTISSMSSSPPCCDPTPPPPAAPSSLSFRLASLGFRSDRDRDKDRDREKGSGSSVGGGGDSKEKGKGGGGNSEDPLRLIGTPVCPRLDECPLLEPLVCKKVAHERLTALAFREDCLVTACQDGYVCTWARPGKVLSQLAGHSTGPPGSPSPMVVGSGLGGSGAGSGGVSGGGTVV